MSQKEKISKYVKMLLIVFCTKRNKRIREKLSNYLNLKSSLVTVLSSVINDSRVTGSFAFSACRWWDPRNQYDGTLASKLNFHLFVLVCRHRSTGY